MCRLFALVSERPKSPELPDLMTNFREQSKQHSDGWGFGWYFDGAPQVEKSPTAAHADARFMTTCMNADSNIVLVHLRKLTVGTPTPDNTQPFSYGDYIFGHNGTVHAKEELRDLLPEEFRGRILGDTDSEQLFYWLLYHIDEKRSALKGIRSAVKYVKENLGPETTAFNFVMSDGEKVYVYRSAYTKHDYYSLMYREREPTEKYPGRSVIVSSNRLGRGTWHPVENDQLLVVDNLLSIEKHQF